MYPFPAIQYSLLAIVLLVGSPGCALFGTNKLEQCRSESERLLSDFRQQRDRADALAEENRQIQGRLAELERKLAAVEGDRRLATRPEHAGSGKPAKPTENPAATVPRSRVTPPPPAHVRQPSDGQALLGGLPQAAPAQAAPPAVPVAVPSTEPLKPLPDPWRRAARN